MVLLSLAERSENSPMEAPNKEHTRVQRLMPAVRILKLLS
jgi:hypothetical protein